jgi:beta-galactosidase
LADKPQAHDFEILRDAESVNLPYDALAFARHSFDSPAAECNGYYGAATLTLYKEFPLLPRHHKVMLDLQGVSGLYEALVNGRRVASAADPSRRVADITDCLKPVRNVLKLKLSHKVDSGKYTGLGVAGGVKLLVYEKPLHIAPYGVFVVTESLGDKARLLVDVEVKNDSAQPVSFAVLAEILNAKGKRVTKKMRKARLAPRSQKIFRLPVNMSRHYAWSDYDPYLYACKVSLLSDTDKPFVYDGASVSFGIRKTELVARALKSNGKPLKLKGAVMAADNGILGNVSEPAAEIIKLTKIRDAGFNAARYTGCPTDAVLNALDKLGINCVVDIFDALGSSAFLGDGHLSFDRDYAEIIEFAVKTLRNHPSVVMYGIASDADESYGRGGGYETAKTVAAEIKKYDPFKLLTANATERVPTASELEKFDIHVSKTDPAVCEKIMAASREKDMFRRLTDEYFDAVDVAGYGFLTHRFAADKLIPGRVITGTAVKSDALFESFDEVDKSPNIIGDFLFTGADFIGRPDPAALDGRRNALTRPHINTSGAFDITLRKKDAGYYAEILTGKKTSSRIVVQNPEALDEDPSAGFTADNTHHLWNWPRHIGKPIKVRVYSAGDIVSLTLDGKPIGRKLAGKFNRYVAEFKTTFFPGKLEAVSFHKGTELCRAVLETVTSPKAVRLEAFQKIIEPGSLAFVEILVVDKEGRVVPYAVRDVEAHVEGAGRLVALGNADPERTNTGADHVCPVYNGAALAVIRGTEEGKITIKVVGDGLSSYKTTIKVKPSSAGKNAR